MESFDTIQNNRVKMITWLVAFYLLLTPLDFLPIVAGASLSKILILIPVCGWLLYLTSIKIRFDRYLVVPVIYVIIILTSSFYSYDASATIQRIVTICMNIAAILVLSTVNYDANEINILKKAIVYSGWFTLVLMIFYAKTDLVGGLRLTVAVNGVYQDPNYLTGFLIFPILFYYFDLISNKKKLSLIKMSVFIIFILLTGSRGGLLALIGALLFLTLIWSMRDGFSLKTFAKIVSVILGLILLFVVTLNFLPEEIVNRYNLASVIASGGTGRTDIWVEVKDQYSDFSLINKLFGGGAGTVKFFTDGEVAHNLWLESFIEVGVVGSVVFIVFYYIFFKKAYQMKEYVVVSSLFGYIVMSLSLSLYSYKPIWNIMLLILILKNSEDIAQDNPISPII